MLLYHSCGLAGQGLVAAFSSLGLFSDSSTVVAKRQEAIERAL